MVPIHSLSTPYNIACRVLFTEADCIYCTIKIKSYKQDLLRLLMIIGAQVIIIYFFCNLSKNLTFCTYGYLMP